MSKKVADNIEVGLWTEYGDRAGCYTAVAGRHLDYQGDYFYISFHKGRMPAFMTRTYDTLEQLVSAMRELEPDLRKWHVRKPE